MPQIVKKNNTMGVDRELWARSQWIIRRWCLSQDLSDEGGRSQTNIQELATQREQKFWLGNKLVPKSGTSPVQKAGVTSHLVGWQSSMRQGKTDTSEHVGKREPLWLLVGLWIGPTTVENNMVVSRKIKNTVIIWSGYPTSGYLSRGKPNHCLKKILASCVQCSIIYTSQEMDTTWASLGG